MTNITKHRSPPQQKWQAPRPHDFPVIQHNGENYQLVPEALLNQLKNQTVDRTWFAIGVAAVCLAGITALIAGMISRPAPTVVEKPVVVEKQVVVPTNCLLFCK